MRFEVTIQIDREVVYQAVHEADGTEPALHDAMQAARKSCPGMAVYLSQVTLRPVEISAPH